MKKPEKEKYLKEARKKQNVSRYAIPEVRRLRERLDPDIDVRALEVYPLIEAYLCRWEIEVNFRDAKTDIGVGQAQVWNDCSIERTPAFMMLCYSCLLLASILAVNDERDQEIFGQRPKWRRDHPRRPSCKDLLRLLAHEVADSGVYHQPKAETLHENCDDLEEAVG